MIELHNLSNFLEKKKKKRIGRGQGSGKGGTSTRGHKGAKSRSGNVKKIGFEGGQIPLQRSIPKIGFTSIKKKKYVYINLGFLQKIIKKNEIKKNEKIEIINKKFYIENNIIKKKNKKFFIKILNKGFFNLKLKIFANKFSKNSIITIKKFGGEYILL